MQHKFTERDFLTDKRTALPLGPEVAGAPWVHFQANSSFGYRLFTHWYTFFLFGDLATDRYMKRMVRDYLHYNEELFCVGHKIVAALDAETGGRGKWSSFHIRRGELQYKNVKIEADQVRRRCCFRWPRPVPASRHTPRHAAPRAQTLARTHASPCTLADPEKHKRVARAARDLVHCDG